MTKGNDIVDSENPLLLSRALLSRLLSQSEVPVETSIEELIAPDSASVTDDGKSESSFSEDQNERLRNRSYNFDNLSEKKWSPFDDPSMLKAHRPVEGSRKQRRWAHLYDIMRDANVTEEDLHIFIQKDTTFSILLKSPELLKWWYQFTRASETAQLSYLKKIDQKRSSSNQTRNETGIQLSSEQCFLRIDKSNRKLLKKSNIPTGVIAQIENHVIQYLMSENEYDFCDMEIQQESDEEFDFCEVKNQKSHLTLEISDPFARLLGHSVCQYYGLSSKSEGEGESRVIKAKRTKKGAYFPPPMRLSSYLVREAK